MFNLSSLQDQVSIFIVNNTYFRKTKSKRSYLDKKKRNVMATKLSISSIAPSLKAVLT